MHSRQFDYNSFQRDVEPLFNLDVLRNIDTTLQIRATSGEWHISDLSLRPAQDTGFSPDEYNIECDLTGNCNYEVAPHPSYFESIKDEALIYNKEFGIETKVYSKEEFNEIGHSGEEQFGAFSYKPGFAINPLKFLIGLAEQAQKSGVKIYQKSKVDKIEKPEFRFTPWEACMSSRGRSAVPCPTTVFWTTISTSLAMPFASGLHHPQKKPFLSRVSRSPSISIQFLLIILSQCQYSLDFLSLSFFIENIVNVIVDFDFI